RYLAVAHYGRGRGEWVEAEYPAHWRPLVESIVARHRERFEAAWAQAAEGAAADDVATRLAPVLAECAREALATLYPESVSLFDRRP
ncbi:MAG TPA: DUF3482 domain-containing protein, partial [Usitatibacter sp.]|nr:DUF3482 domain-containing protein [Usitatibacter sp.]